jgi:hypothetical protein
MKPFYLLGHKLILRSDRFGPRLLGSASKWVLLVLMDRAKDGRWPASASVLAFEAGCPSTRSARSALQNLKRLGLIRLTRVDANGGYYQVDEGKIEAFVSPPKTDKVLPPAERTLSSKTSIDPHSTCKGPLSETNRDPDSTGQHPKQKESSQGRQGRSGRAGSSLFGHRSDPPNPTGDSFLGITKGLEEPGSRSVRIDQAEATDRPEEDPHDIEIPAEWYDHTPEPITGVEPEMTENDYEKPPIDKARLNGWHLAKKRYYRVWHPGSSRPNVQSADITWPDELQDWQALGCKVEEFELEETVDKTGAVIRPEAVEEEREKQEKFKARLRERSRAEMKNTANSSQQLELGTRRNCRE